MGETCECIVLPSLDYRGTAPLTAGGLDAPTMRCSFPRSTLNFSVPKRCAHLHALWPTNGFHGNTTSCLDFVLASCHLHYLISVRAIYAFISRKAWRTILDYLKVQLAARMTREVGHQHGILAYCDGTPNGVYPSMTAPITLSLCRYRRLMSRRRCSYYYMRSRSAACLITCRELQLGTCTSLHIRYPHKLTPRFLTRAHRV